MIKLSILPLPGEINILDGKYGLEICYARGMVRIHFLSDFTIVDLRLSVEGSQLSSFWDTVQTFDSVTRRKQLFCESSSLLSHITLSSNPSGYIDIPFEVPFPLHEPITAGFGPCLQLLPNSGTINGKANYHEYKAFTEYSISCTLSIPSSIPLLSSKIQTTLPLHPFTVYDPRLIPLILHPEERRWKSHIGAEPIEYDIEVSSGVFGPHDRFKLEYRILVNGQYARRGVRIRKITFTLKETQIVGEGRCCAQDDSKGNWRHSHPMRVRGTREILNWSQVEYPPPENNWLVDTSSYYGRNAKYDGLAIPDRVYPGQDGIYVERSVELEIPSLNDFHPSTPNFVYPPDDHICRHIRPRNAYISVRHTICVHIEMRGSDSISIEAGCYMVAVGKLDCQNLLKTDAEIVPTLDYNKITGGIEVWVPEYSERSDTDPACNIADAKLVENFGQKNTENEIINHIPERSHVQRSRRAGESVGNSGEAMQEIPSSPPPPFSLYYNNSTQYTNMMPHCRISMSGGDEYDQIIDLMSRERFRLDSVTRSIYEIALEMDKKENVDLVGALREAMETSLI